MLFEKKDDILVYHYDAETVWIQPWGENSLRVRATKNSEMLLNNWALSIKPQKSNAVYEINEEKASITNGNITAEITKYGKMRFTRSDGKLLLDEYLRNRKDKHADYCSALNIDAREFKSNIGGDYHLSMHFVSDPSERIYGMGQYQQPYLNLKGADLELAQ